MRPVLLRMEGFAAFRAETIVDFSDADYFALVGPTGSGKSTVIDAMVFALYGSVPRWDDQRTVRLALAPTTARGTVSLVFDLGDRRFVVARELRRSSSGGVTVREARLEQLHDTEGRATPGEDTTSLETGSRVTQAVIELLGLPFEDFCTCVVLPQGDFAEFLHEVPSKRQEKLKNLLGLGIYDQIMKRAGTEVASATQRCEFLDEQLAGLADTTPEVERAAEERVTQLTALADQVAVVVRDIGTAASGVTEAETERGRLTAERATLNGVRPPSDLDTLIERHRSGTATLAEATQQAAAADDQETAARAELDAAPDRAGLERIRRAHLELNENRERLPVAEQRREQASAAFTAAAAHAETAARHAVIARDALSATAGREQAAREESQRLAGERAALLVPVVPEGLDDLHARTVAAAEERKRSDEQLTATEADEARARADLAAAPSRGPLEHARRDRRDLAAAEEEHRAAEHQVQIAEREVVDVASRVDRTRHQLDAARQHRERQARIDVAAELRPHLSVGDPCPVCAQRVAHLPEPLSSAGLDAARDAETAAEKAYQEAVTAHSGATAAIDSARDHETRTSTRVCQLQTALVDAPTTLAAIEEALADLDRQQAATEQTAHAAHAARRARDDAAAAQEGLRHEESVAATALRDARDPLVHLGAPAAADASPLTGWRALVDWAHHAAEERSAALAAADEALTEATGQREEAERHRNAAESADSAARRAETDAAREDQQAQGSVTTLEARIDELHADLTGAPTLADAEAGLQRLSALEDAHRRAITEARDARSALSTARAALTEVEQSLAGSWRTWHGLRGSLVKLGAPEPVDDLAAAWRLLSAWAENEIAAREQAIADADTLLDRRRKARDDAEAHLAEALAEHGLTATAHTAPTTVAIAVERARGDLARIVERRAEAEDLRAKRAAVEEDAQVARMLVAQLRSDHFPRWLVASALDALVADASASLANLSSGQFELTHDDGEFVVVDHADADQRRPVKTLSGGETFQASLALALALSSQLQGLAAHGAARLESIFLDEGFGTLDETNLDLVATALENLSASGDRMVGVVTHVSALAERVPVRFAVSRDQRTSSVVREGP